MVLNAIYQKLLLGVVLKEPHPYHMGASSGKP